MAKFTDDDIAEIVNALRREEGKFAFLTGAGCSLSAGIPSGAKMAADICAAYSHETRRLSDAEKANYALCMACLPIETRKKIINDYLKSPEVKLNWAHIAKPSIVHLHGQGSGSVLLNTEKETEKHAVELEPLLSDTFANYPMVVMGYSGESDKVFDKIKTLYRGDQCLYWLGHSEEPAPHLASFINDIDGSGYCKYIGGADADQFLIQLAQQLNCFPPQVFANPAVHLLAEMKDIAPYPLNDAMPFDILENTIERLKTHQTALLFTRDQTAVLSNNPASIDPNDTNTSPKIVAWALVERGNEHYYAARKSNSISEYEKSAQQYDAAIKIKPDMHEALNNWGNALSDLADLKQDPALFEAGFDKFKDALSVKPDSHKVLNNWGLALSKLAVLKHESKLFEASFIKFEAALDIKQDYHQALFNWGSSLSNLAQLKKDVVLLEASFAKFDSALKIKPDYTDAFNNWESSLLKAWHLTNNKKYLEQATHVTSQAEKLNPDKCYNGACLAAIKNDEEGCKVRLFRAKASKTLPTPKHLEEDEDLANMRDKPWFAELLKDL